MPRADPDDRRLEVQRELELEGTPVDGEGRDRRPQLVGAGGGAERQGGERCERP